MCSFADDIPSNMGNDMAITFADAVHSIFDNDEGEDDEQGELESDHDTPSASEDGEDACEIVLD